MGGPRAERPATSTSGQLRDMKIKLLVELFTPSVMVQYAEYCGWALAMEHSRAGQLALIAGYLGQCDQFDELVAGSATAFCPAKGVRL